MGEAVGSPPGQKECNPCPQKNRGGRNELSSALGTWRKSGN